MTEVILFSDKSKIQQSVKDVLSDLNINLVAVVTEKNPNLKLLPKADLLICVCYHYKISSNIIKKYPVAINFHPAPLPEYKGWAVYNFGLYNNEDRWGVSAHYITDKIDRGEILAVQYFDIGKETVKSLREKSHSKLIYLFKNIITAFKNGEKINSIENQGGTYYSQKMFEELREIKTHMDSKEIEKRIRACHFPPYKGAYIKLGDQNFMILQEDFYDTNI